MKVLCAWCVREGKPAFLRDKAPLDDPSETHGLCADHFKSLSSGVSSCVHWTAHLTPFLHDLYWSVNWRVHRWIALIRP